MVKGDVKAGASLGGRAIPEAVYGAKSEPPPPDPPGSPWPSLAPLVGLGPSLVPDRDINGNEFTSNVFVVGVCVVSLGVREDAPGNMWPGQVAQLKPPSVSVPPAHLGIDLRHKSRV